MGDLVERLRFNNDYGIFTAQTSGKGVSFAEAADRIEALEKAIRDALDAPMIDHSDSRRGKDGILRQALGEGQ